ncbi:MAG TPA: DUF1802 family protein [Gemmataceae bacterium]|nr:DUF1802 family protein [Gemmataceae bacterium]
MNTLRHAFKEWAVICRALAEGRQAFILRKGGIAENGGEFRVEHTRFWLYPTSVHQQKDGITPETVPLLEQIEREQPPQGIVRLSHFVEVTGLYHIHDLMSALRLAGLHGWSQETVQARFAYRQPGLYVLPVRVYRAPRTFELSETADYAGCRSWVELDRELPTEGATPVLDEEAFDDVLRTLDRLLQPTAWV